MSGEFFLCIGVDDREFSYELWVQSSLVDLFMNDTLLSPTHD